ncbi:hypothetical protein Tco_1406686 [Tanacetum coccineum]
MNPHWSPVNHHYEKWLDSTAKADFYEIRRIRHEPYTVSGTQHKSLFFETVPFPGRMQNFGYGDWREAQDVKILDTYDHSLPQTEKDPGSFTLPCLFIISVLIKLLLTLEQDEGKSHAGTLIDIPVFVGSFSIISGFTIIDDDDMTKDVVLGMKFCKKYASCQRIMKRFALGNNYERIMEDE